MHKNNPYLYILTLILGSTLAVALSTSATSIGNNVSITGNLSVSSTDATSTLSTGGLTIGTNQLVVQQNSGKVGVGTTNPAYTLDVSGTLNVTGAVSCGSGCAAGPWTRSGSNTNLANSGDSVGIGTTSPWGLFSINPTKSIGVNPQFAVGSSSATSFVVDNAGNVGIGTTTPSMALDVNGRYQVTGGTLGSEQNVGTITATLSSTAVGQTGFQVAITSAGTQNVRQVGSSFRLDPGYTGPQATYGLQVVNNTLGTAGNPWQDTTLTGNVALRALAQGSQPSSGANVGVWGSGSGAALNVGVMGYSNGSSLDTPNAVQIGVVGLAYDRNISGDQYNPQHEGLIHISGLFTGGSGYTSGRANESAVIMADDSWPGNGEDVPHPIFLGRINNGTNVFDINHYGVTYGGEPGNASTTNAIWPKTVTGIADATATNVLTVTVPNAAHVAIVHVRILGSLGAGGAVGAFECSAALEGNITVARTAGVATVATASTASQTSSSCVAGATTITLAYSVSSMSGANNATQTFTVQVTITKGGGASANHQAVVSAEVLNSQANGVTIQ